MRTAPDIRTPLPGPKAAAIIARDRARVSPSYTRDYPFVMARGEGAVVEDVDGNVFLDCAAGIAVTGTGHSHPDVVKAIVEQAHKYLHMSGTDFYYEPQVRLAEEMAAIVPIGARDGDVRSFFSNSGTEANEAALKLARYATKRFNIIAFLGSFHGRTLGSLAATSSKYIQRKGFGPMMPGVYHAPYANCYRCPVGQRPESCAAECLSYVEDQILVHLVSPDEVAGVLVEPIQGEGGYVVPPTAVPAAAARADLAARHPAHRRRSAVRHGTHGPHVCVRALRRQRRHRDRCQRHRLRAAARRDELARLGDDLAAWRARVDVWRQPGELRRRHRNDWRAEKRPRPQRRGGG